MGFFKKAMEAYNLNQFFGGKSKNNILFGEEVAKSFGEGMSKAQQQIHVGKEFNDKMDALGYGVKYIHSGGPCVECNRYTHKQVDSRNVYMCGECFDELQKDIEAIRNPVYTESKTLRQMMEEDMDKKIKEAVENGDMRYNKPKEAPKASKELVEDTINNTEIYREAKQRILKAQHKQVAYGLDKYPTPLSADVWDIYETIDHVVDEAVDQLHYLVMLQIHLKRLLDGPKMVMTGGYDKLDKKTVMAAIEENWGVAEPGTIFADGVAVEKYKLKDEYIHCDISYDSTEGFTRVDDEPLIPLKHLENLKKPFSTGITIDGEDMFVDGVKMYDLTPNGSKIYTPNYFRKIKGFEVTPNQARKFSEDKANINFDDVPKETDVDIKFTTQPCSYLDPLSQKQHIKIDIHFNPEDDYDELVSKISRQLNRMHREGKI
jgi:hypothetical protein